MAFEWLLGEQPILDEFTGLPTSLGTPSIAGRVGEGLSNIDFSDPNLQRFMAEAGASLGGEGSFAESIGKPTSEMVRRQQFQQAGGQQLQRQNTLQERLLELLSGGRLLSPSSQNDAFDSFSVTGDGDINLKMKNTPQEQQFLGEQKRPEQKDFDFLNFSKGQPDSIDLAGLNPEDVKTLMQADVNYKNINRQAMQGLIDKD
jgi:hypothetical protein